MPTGPSSHRSGDATENDATTPGARAAIGRHVTELRRRGRGQVTWQVPRSGRVRRATPRESARAATIGARPMHEAPVVSALRNSSRSRRRPGRTGGAGARRSDAALTIAARPCGCIPLYPRCGCSEFGLRTRLRFLYCSGPRGGRSGSAIRRWRRAAAAAARAWTWRFPLPGFELRYRRGARRSDRPGGVRDRFPALILRSARQEMR